MNVNKGELHAALKRCMALKAKAPLDSAQLSAKDGQLTVDATDGSNWVRSVIPCSPGSFATGVRLADLLACVKGEGEGQIALRIDRKGLCVTSSGRETTLAVTPHGDGLEPFPGEAPDLTWTRAGEWDGKMLKNELKWVLLAASTDITRQGLNTVLIDGDVMVATDGHRLHRAHLGGAAPRTAMPAPYARALAAILTDGPVVLERSIRLVRLRAYRTELVGVVSVHAFPQYQQVIPSKGSEIFRVTVAVDVLQAALKTLPRKGTPNTRLTVNGKLTLEHTTDERTDRAAVPVLTSTHEGDDFVAGVNHHYLADALSGETGTLRFEDPLSPIVVTGGERLAVVMPMRI